ncbi:hypothetical protein LTS15_007013 [Exophiala xenobiotica]|nr:hypothetical protein LTS15_007013 [Exophiala xenobiotica]
MSSTTQPPENSMAPILFQSNSMSQYYDLSFVPSTFQNDDRSSQNIVDFFLESLDCQSAQAEHIRRASSVVESDISELSSTSTSTSTSHQHTVSVSSHNMAPMYDVASQALGLLSEQDRRHRRREQNRKAQHSFREKRKSEARKVEKELADLKMQLAGFRRNAALPTAGWTLCASCRNFFYPPTTPPPNAGEGVDVNLTVNVNADHDPIILTSPSCFVDEFAFEY